MVRKQPKYQLHLTIEAEILDDRTEQLVAEAIKSMQQQAAAYVQNGVMERVLERLGREARMPANWAQAAVAIFEDELAHVHLKISEVSGTMVELKEAEQTVAKLGAGEG